MNVDLMHQVWAALSKEVIELMLCLLTNLASRWRLSLCHLLAALATICTNYHVHGG